MNSVFTRRSVRTFSDKKVEAEKLDKILRAGMQAPSAGNQQPWEFIIIRERKNLDELSSYNPYAGCLKSATLGIIVLFNKNSKSLKYPEYWQQDLSSATQNIMIEATELGLGSVWLGTAPDLQRMKFIKDLYNLDENLIPFSVIALGYPKNQNANYFMDRFDESKIKYID